MWSRIDSQEVGSEAAILERVRNSSLVKWFCADNVAGLKHATEDADAAVWPCGRRASHTGAKRRGNPAVDCVGVRMQT